MARRIYRRTVSYDGLSSKQLNSLGGKDQYLAQFSGLNTGKNYTTIDQNSFSNVNNMFIDTDERLSTRPPIETSADDKYSSIHIVSYKAINGIAFFVINVGDDTKLVSDLGYNNSLITLGDITTSGKLFFVNGKYIVFDTDKIWGFSIDHTNKSYTTYTESDLIYIPTSQDLNPRNDRDIAKNIFTPNTLRRIIYTSANVTGETNPPDDGEFVSKDVVVHMNGKDYNKKWTANQWRTFVYELYKGEVLDKVTNIEFSKSGKYVIAFTPKDMDNKTFTDGFYYSENGGRSFTLVSNPCDDISRGRTVCISEDERGILYVGYNNSKLYVAYSDFPIDGVNFTWETYDDVPSRTTFNAYTRNTSSDLSNRRYCYTKQNYDPTCKNIIAHCIDKLNFVICFGTDDTSTFTTFTYYTTLPTDSSDIYKETVSTKLFPIIIHAYTNGKWNYALHYHNNYLDDNSFDIYSSYIIPNKSRVRMITDGEGRAVISIGYFSLGNPVFMQAFLSKDYGFTPGVFEGTDVERDRTYCGIVTCLDRHPLRKALSETKVIDNNWMDVFGTVKVSSSTGYDYDRLLFGIYSNMRANVYNITMDNSYEADHKPFADLLNTTQTKRQNPAYKFISTSTESQYKNYITSSDSITASISLGMILTQTALKSTSEGVLKNDGEIELFDKVVRPLYVNSSGDFVYLYDGALYRNGIDDEVTVTIYEGDISYNYLIPDFINEIVTNNFTFVFGDSVYQSYYGDGKLYVPEYTKDTLEGEITNVIRFSDTSLGLFLENSVYEYQYNYELTSQNEIPSFTRHPTKLQLGCLKGSDIVYTYDGASIIMTTKRGVAVLNYQQFVQSTEQVYTFLSNNIDDYYEQWSGKYTKPIKITLFKSYILFYQVDNPKILVFDTRNQSWWPWELSDKFKIIADIENNLSLVVSNSEVTGLKLFNFNNKTNYKDYDGTVIRWRFETQPLHFQSPTFYKHISRFSIVTTDTPNKIAFDLQFKIYQNLNNVSECDTVFNKMEMLTTIIERVNFIKANALKVICSSNDDYTKNQFITSAIIIHYRPTEVIR